MHLDGFERIALLFVQDRLFWDNTAICTCNLLYWLYQCQIVLATFQHQANWQIFVNKIISQLWVAVRRCEKGKSNSLYQTLFKLVSCCNVYRTNCSSHLVAYDLQLLAQMLSRRLKPCGNIQADLIGLLHPKTVNEKNKHNFPKRHIKIACGCSTNDF